MEDTDTGGLALRVGTRNLDFSFLKGVREELILELLAGTQTLSCPNLFYKMVQYLLIAYERPSHTILYTFKITFLARHGGTSIERQRQGDPRVLGQRSTQ